jgi:hypothetical protein
MPGENFQNGYLKTQNATLRRRNYAMSLDEALAVILVDKIMEVSELPTDDLGLMRQSGNSIVTEGPIAIHHKLKLREP